MTIWVSVRSAPLSGAIAKDHLVDHHPWNVHEIVLFKTCSIETVLLSVLNFMYFVLKD